MDQRVAKWQGWCDGTIKNNVLAMHLHRHAWREVSDILQAHGSLPDSYWWEFMLDTYAVTQAAAVRRQADTHRDAASLGKLIEEIASEPEKITRSFWLGQWRTSADPYWQQVAENAWKTQYAFEDGDRLNPAMPAEDFDALMAATAGIKAYVDRHIAHADSSAVAATVTLQVRDVHAAIDVIGDLFRKYFNLLTASSIVELVPMIQHDWKAVFREPWLRLSPEA